MIDEKLLLKFIRTKKKEFEEESFTNYEKYTNNLKNMGSMGVVTATVDIYVLMNLVRILNELIEMIESGKFDVVEKSKKKGGRKNMKKTICVDFDGVLSEYNGYEEGNPGEPLSASKEFIRQLRKKYEVIILTSRPKEQVIDWLNNNGFPSMEVTNRKIPAVAYIDDRAIQFNGSYILTIYEALNFKPYWEN